MNNAAGRGALIAVSVDVRHHIVPQPAFMGIGGGEIDVSQCPCAARRFAPWRNRQPQLRFRLGQPNPKLPPSAELLAHRPKAGSFPAKRNGG